MVLIFLLCSVDKLCDCAKGESDVPEKGCARKRLVILYFANSRVILALYRVTSDIFIH